MTIPGNVINTVTFFQGAFTIILSLSLGEALKSFTSDNQDHPLYWNRAPALGAFLLLLFPFFQSMNQYFYATYLNPQTALNFNSRYLVFDSIMYMIEAGCFFTMSRSLSPHRWQRFYGTVLVLMAIDIAWAGVSYFRGVHVGGWLLMDFVVVAGILAMMLFERGRGFSMRPSYVGLMLLIITTTTSYWLEQDMYFP